jgi:hypothetical protein
MDCTARGLRARLVSLVCVTTATSLGAAGCGLERREDHGWTSLFNGTDLTGWTVNCKPGDADNSFWRVEDGTIVADSLKHRGHDYVWLMTNRQYSDFVLRLRFQAFRDSPGNSGVQIRSRYDDEAGWLDGPQVDINPPGPWRTGMIWDETRGSKRWLYPDVPKGQWVNESMAPGDLVFHYADDEPNWNTLEIEAVGPTIRAWLNGVLVTDYDGTGVLDDATHRRHDVGMRGHIALQIHRGDQLHIRFDGLEIKEPAAK